MGLFGFGKSDKGYGPADRRMADALRSARSREQADKIARDNGLKNAKDAKAWLRERS